MMIKNNDVMCLQIQFGASKEEIREAVAHVGTNLDEIEQYLQRKTKSHLVQLLHQNNPMQPNELCF